MKIFDECPKLLIRPFKKLNPTEKTVVTFCYTFAGINFVVFACSFSLVSIALSLLGFFAGTIARANREFLEGVVKQSYSPPITEEEVEDFSNTVDADMETPNDNPSTNENLPNNQTGGTQTQMNPIYTIVGALVVLGIVLVALPIAPFFIGLIAILALCGCFSGYKLGKKSK